MRFLRPLYMQVLIAVVLGCVFGHYFPGPAVSIGWMAQYFIKLITMLISPIIFCTIVVGFGNMRELKKVGTVGLKALIYFEVVTTFALILGLIVVDTVRPGAGIHASARQFDMASLQPYLNAAGHHGFVDFMMGLVPRTFFSALTDGEILQVLLAAMLFGAALVQMGEKGAPITALVELLSKVFMKIVFIVVLLSPVAVFAAMGLVVAKFGMTSLRQLGMLMVCVYGTMVIFIVFVLGAIVRLNGLNLWRLFRYLRDEFWLVVGTSSSETALPGLMTKLEKMGCSKSVVDLVVPAGYSFNLDGTCIYLTMAAVFIAQATDTPLDLWQQLGIVGLLLLTSKGAAAVTGGGFITLASTLKTYPMVPIGGLSLILGVDRFMSQARAITNLLGNAVATITVARWERGFDRELAVRTLQAPQPPQ